MDHPEGQFGARLLREPEGAVVALEPEEAEVPAQMETEEAEEAAVPEDQLPHPQGRKVVPQETKWSVENDPGMHD